MHRIHGFLLPVVLVLGCLHPATRAPLPSIAPEPDGPELSAGMSTPSTGEPDLSTLTEKGPGCGYWVVGRTNADRSLALVVRTTREGKGPGMNKVRRDAYDLATTDAIEVELVQGTEVTGATCTDLPLPEMQTLRVWKGTRGRVTTVLTGANRAIPDFGVRVTLEDVLLVDEAGYELVLPTMSVVGGGGWYPG